MLDALALLLNILILGLAFVFGSAIAKVRTLTRIANVMSHTEFYTPCEIIERVVATYRPFIRPHRSTAEHVLSFGEQKKIFVGRECSRCCCNREYCLSIRIRRKRRKSVRLKEWWDGAWRPA